MEEELAANAYKGDWRMWEPTREQALSELDHHVSKLRTALNDQTAEANLSHRTISKVSEFAADVANIAMKIDEHYGKL